MCTNIHFQVHVFICTYVSKHYCRRKGSWFWLQICVPVIVITFTSQLATNFFGCWRHRGVSFKTAPTTCIYVCMLYVGTRYAIFYVSMLQKLSSDTLRHLFGARNHQDLLSDQPNQWVSISIIQCLYTYIKDSTPCTYICVLIGGFIRLAAPSLSMFAVSLRSFRRRSPSCCSNRQHFSCNCLLFCCEQYK